MVDKNQGGELLSRVRGVRKKLSQELGFLVPTIHIRDNLDLLPTMYRFSLIGVNVAEGEVYADKLLAIDPGEVFGQLQGLATTDPAFGLPAVWIEESDKTTPKPWVIRSLMRVRSSLHILIRSCWKMPLSCWGMMRCNTLSTCWVNLHRSLRSSSSRLRYRSRAC